MTSRGLVVILAACSIAVLACGDEVQSPSSPISADAAPTATLAFRQISAGAWHSCGVTTDNRAWCWGNNFYGQIGNGFGGAAPITRPSAVVTALRFEEVRAGNNYTCGLSTGKRVYCWGLNDNGQLGIGSDALYSLEPAEIAGGRQYQSLRTGYYHACAVTAANVTFCWGLNDYGQLGDGTRTPRRAPVKVAGGVQFLRVSTGWFHTCGVTSAKKAYCWGQGRFGQLGNRSSADRLTPGAVSDNRTFNLVNAGQAHTCGVTTDHKAWCWGWNKYGQLGNGTTSRFSRPTLVAGGLAFSGVSAGGSHTCGITTGGVTYCWGFNLYGQLGEGTNAIGGVPFVYRQLSPVAVVGGVSFDAVLAASGMFTCAVAAGGRGYCWGENDGGYLGDGTTSHQSIPTPIADPS